MRDACDRREQIGQPTEVAIPEMCMPGPDYEREIRRTEISPFPREPSEMSGVVVKEDAVLAPRLPALD